MTRSDLKADTAVKEQPSGGSAPVSNGHRRQTAEPCTQWPGGAVGRTGEFHSRAENFAAECRNCSSNALHVLYVGYSFYEWICDICGTRIETPVSPT